MSETDPTTEILLPCALLLFTLCVPVCSSGWTRSQKGHGCRLNAALNGCEICPAKQSDTCGIACSLGTTKQVMSLAMEKATSKLLNFGFKTV